jgi:hypothetical protein
MTTRDVNCKLAAILGADVKGYNRLMGDDKVLMKHKLGLEVKGDMSCE